MDKVFCVDRKCTIRTFGLHNHCTDGYTVDVRPCSDYFFHDGFGRGFLRPQKMYDRTAWWSHNALDGTSHGGEHLAKIDNRYYGFDTLKDFCDEADKWDARGKRAL